MIILDFVCPHCGHKSEEYVQDKDVQPLCVKCHTFMERLPSAPGMVKGNSSDGIGFKERN